MENSADEMKEATGEPESDAGSSVNSQTLDAVHTLDVLIARMREAGGPEAHLWAVQAIGLAMLNAVNQQQQLYILQNAVTAAAARAVLDKDPQQALALVRDLTSTLPIASTLGDLNTLMEQVLASGAKAGAASRPTPPPADAA